MGWIILAVVVVGAVLLVWAGRKRSWGGASTKTGAISGDDGVNYGNIQMQAQQQSQNGHNGGFFG